MYYQQAENKKDKENKASFTETVSFKHSVEVVDDKMRKKPGSFYKGNRCVINLTDCS